MIHGFIVMLRGAPLRRRDNMPTADGTGQKLPKEVSQNASVDVQAQQGGPGGESSKGSQVHIQGPNSAKGGKK